MKNFNFKKSLGQNFIEDDDVINKIVDSALIDKDTLVIEIGPGVGALSEKLIQKSKNTILYEIDNRLEKLLKEKLYNYDNYELILKDVLTVSLKDDVSKYVYNKIIVVANIPYYITTPIISKLINEIYPDRIVIMIQNEVADRITANPESKNYGYMSVFVQSKYYAQKKFKVDKKYFFPVPKVDSAVIKLDKRTDIKIDDFSFFDKLVRDSFKYKRKNIKNNLNNYNLLMINEILKKYNLSIMCRSEQIPVEVFAEIANVLKNDG